MTSRWILVLIAFFGTVSCSQGFAQERAYPSKPIRMLVGFPPGGSVDGLARVVGPKLTEVWGQQIVVDNRPGAGGTVASEIAARAIADGYTLLVVGSSYAVSAGLFSKLNYHPVDSFAPVALIGSVPMVLVTNTSLRAKSIAELVSMAKASPGKLNFGSGGTGSLSHLSGELLKSMAGVDIVHVPYKGPSLAMTDLMSGRIELLLSSLTGVLPQIKAGRVKALGVSSTKRSPSLPEVPTIAESGLRGYEATGWTGILAPAGTPQPLINKLNAQVASIVQTPEVIAALRKQGAEPEAVSSQTFGTYLKSEIAKWTKVIREAGIRPD